MSRALYRQYRPTSLETVVGQEHITNTLKNALSKGAISHAYLFTGPRGVGKTSIARILAHEINGLTYKEETTHLDIIEIDAASNRRIDEIRELREKVHISPTSAKYKVYIIDEVHMLTREAFNALLKTLEEPPTHAVFILATTEAHKVPETIISRTQRYSFKPIEQVAAAEHLALIAKKEKLKVDKEALQLIANHGRGSFRDSIGMLDQIASFGHDHITASIVADLLGIPTDETVTKLIASIKNQDTVALFSAIQSLKEQGTHAAQLAQSLIIKLRDSVAQNQLTLPQKQTIQLMKALLPHTGSQTSFDAIEITLLDSLETVDSASEPMPEPANNAISPERNTNDDKPAQTPTTVQDEENTTSNVAPDTTPDATNTTAEQPQTDSSSLNQANNAIWQKILQAVKGNHNTLYGVLRMAEADIDGDCITLTFKFAFHKKQITQARHTETLQEIIKKTTNKPYTLELAVKAAQTPVDKQPNKPSSADNDSLENVSNIFGGAELLES